MSRQSALPFEANRGEATRKEAPSGLVINTLSNATAQVVGSLPEKSFAEVKSGIRGTNVAPGASTADPLGIESR